MLTRLTWSWNRVGFKKKIKKGKDLGNSIKNQDYQMTWLTWQDPDKNSIATCWLFFKKTKMM
jgi:hypothetical protein